MKNFKTIFTLLLFAMAGYLAKAQNTVQLENSLLWKVEHSSMEKPSFIFGTLHMMCADDFEMPKKVAKTIAEVDALVLELDLSDPTEMQAMQTAMMATQKISEELSEVQFEQLDTLVQRVVGAPLATLDSYGLSMLNMLMISKMLPCTEIKSFEAELMQIAKTEQLPLYSLETVAEQFAIVEQAYPTDFAYQQIMLFEEYKKDFSNAIIAYNKEELDKTVSLISKPEYMDENAVRLMQTDRNKNWVEQMPEMMEERSNLFAVGAAHLTDSYGIIHLLREKGYTVIPVFN